jgi:hypothetical protein
MSVTGLCEVCGQPDVDDVCDRCGQLVCDRHVNESTGICVECAGEVGRPTDPTRHGDPDREGTDTYRF